MLLRNLMNNFKTFELSDLIVLRGWANKQSNNPTANVGPNASKSPAATLTALHRATHKIHMMKVYGNPLTTPAVWKREKQIFYEKNWFVQHCIIHKMLYY